MPAVTNELLAILFVVLAAASTFLMYHLWGYPWDKERLRSSAPPRLVRLHRFVGYAYVLIYLYLMVQMLPRLWTYQIELPARTVAHLLLGMAIGSVLVVKIMIVRFFKHLEGTLIPFLGTLLFVFSVLLVGLAVPSSIREAVLRRAAAEGDAFRPERIERVRTLLPVAGLSDPDSIQRLSSADGLISGREVLRTKCVQCHDLRTILARPRTPASWRQVVGRMAQRSTTLSPIEESEQWEVIAYLIAITPTLQETVERLRAQEVVAANTAEAVQRASEQAMGMDFDVTAAAALFESRCSLCHGTDRVRQAPPRSEQEAMALVQRMVSNGLVATEDELATVIRYLVETFVAGR